MQILLEIILDSSIINLNPPSKSLGCRRFQHVRERSLEKSLLFVKIACLVDPSVETACNLHVSGSRYEIRHDFLAQTFHLRNSVHLDSVGDFDRPLNIFYLVLVFCLSPSQLFDVFDVDVLGESGHSLFPSSHSIELLVTVYALLSSIEELLAHFERADKHQP